MANPWGTLGAQGPFPFIPMGLLLLFLPVVQSIFSQGLPLGVTVVLSRARAGGWGRVADAAKSCLLGLCYLGAVSQATGTPGNRAGHAVEGRWENWRHAHPLPSRLNRPGVSSLPEFSESQLGLLLGLGLTLLCSPCRTKK